MEQIYQVTLKNAVSFHCHGLHTGKEVIMTVYPAQENTGVVFFINGQKVPAHFSFVEETFYCTALEKNAQKVRTVEHFLSAVFALGLDNLKVELSSEELPCLDGSCTEFYWGLLSVGLKVQKSRKIFAYISETVQLTYHKSIVSIEPSITPKVSVNLDYDIPVTKGIDLSMTFDLFEDDFFSEIARARTYGFEKDLKFFEEKSLAQGVTLDNCLVMNQTHVLSPGGRRFKSEMVRHKILDIFGDLFLLGHRFIGHYKALRPGHHLNYLLVKKLVKERSYELKEFEGKTILA